MIPAEISADVIGQWVGQHLWPLFRLASFLMVIPIFGTQLVPARIRLGLALLMTILIAPMIPPVPQVEALSADAVVITLQQILIGVGMGFALTALWQLFVIAGQMIAMQMGLGFAGQFDPSLGDMALPMRRIVYVVASFAFVSVGGLQNAARIALLPPVDFTVLFMSYGSLMRASGELFLVGIHFALPIMVAVTVANIAMGLANRAAPALNVYSVMLSITGLMGAGILLLTSPMMASEIMARAYRAVASLPGF